MLRRAVFIQVRRLSTTKRTPVCIDYADLIAGKSLRAEIEEAYGFDGLGLLTVKNVPGVVAARKQLLPLAQVLLFGCFCGLERTKKNNFFTFFLIRNSLSCPRT